MPKLSLDNPLPVNLRLKEIAIVIGILVLFGLTMVSILYYSQPKPFIPKPIPEDADPLHLCIRDCAVMHFPSHHFRICSVLCICSNNVTCIKTYLT